LGAFSDRSPARDLDIRLITTEFRFPRRLPSRFLGAVLALSFLADPGTAQILVTNSSASGAGSFASAVGQAALTPSSVIEFSGTDGDIALGSPLGVSNTPTISALGTTALTIRNALSVTGLLTMDMSGVSGTISGAIGDGTSPGSLLVQDTVGGGKLVLTGANTFTGGTTINSGVTVGVNNNGSLGAGAVTFSGGTLQTQAQLSNFANALALTGAGILDLDGSASTFSGPISGAGALTITDSSAGGGGSAALTGADSGGGGLNITAGSGAGGITVLAGAAGALGSGPVVMTGDASSALLNLQGNGQTVASLGGDSRSTLNLDGAALTVNGSGLSTTFAGTIEDTAGTPGTLTMSGANSTLVLSGDNTYAGGTILDAGTLGVTNNNGLGTGALTVNGGTLQTQGALSSFNNAIVLNANGTVDIDGNGSTFTGVVSGSGGLTVVNSNGTTSGVLSLQGANTYLGPTTVSNGATVGITNLDNLGMSPALTLSNGGGLQTQTGFANFGVGITLAGTGGTIDIDGANSSFVAGTISGSGALTVTNSGNAGAVLTLQGANSYTGGTTIENNAIVGIGAVDALGAGGLTLINGGALQLQSAMTYNTAITLGGTGATGGTVDVHGTQSTLSGAIGGSGALTIKDSVGGGVLTLTGADSGTGGTDITGVAGTAGVSVVAGAAGALGDGPVVMAGNGASANLNLGGYATTIASLTGDLNSTLNLYGSALTINGGGLSTTFAGTIEDTAGSVGSVALSGAGSTMVLSGNNTYAGGTTIDAGTIGVANDNSLGTGAVTLDGGTLQTQGALTSYGNSIVLQSGGGTIDLDGGSANSSSFGSGVIGGSGALTVTNSAATPGAVLTLLGGNRYSGGTTIENGAIVGISQVGALGTGGLTLSDGTLQTQSALSNFNTAVVLSGTTGGTVDLDGNASTFSGPISGAGALTITDSSTDGGGALTLTGANSYSGGTNITAGAGLSGVTVLADAAGALGGGGVNMTGASAAATAALNLQGNAETIASLGGNADSVLDLDGAALTVSGGASGTSTTFAGVIQDSAGGGTLALNEAGGTLVLSGANTYGGGTTLTAGTLGVTNNASLGTGAVTLNGGTLQTQGALTDFANAVALGGGATLDLDGYSSTFTGGITGGGSLTVMNSDIGTNGNNVLTLSGSNGYTGGTTIGNGVTVGINNAAGLGTGAVTFDGGALQTQAGLSNFTNAINLAGAGTVDLDGKTSTFSGAIGGTGSAPLTITDGSAGGGGALTLTGSNSTTTGLDIAAGTGAGGISVTAGAAGALGSGGVVMTGSPSLATLSLDDFAETIASLSGDTKSTLDLDGAALTLNGSGASTTFAGVIKDTLGTGSLNMAGSGSTLILSGNNTYAGGTTLSAGILGVGKNGSLGTGLLTISGGTLQTDGTLTNLANAVLLTGAATLDLNGNTSTLSGAISGSGPLTVINNGAGGGMTLTGSNGYSGGTTIEAGATLGVSGAGSLGTGSLNVAGGAFNLNGFSQTIGGGVVNNGTISTGFGTLTAPSYSGAGALSVAVQPSAPSLAVSGSVNLANGSVLSVSNHPAAGTYTVVTAAGTFNNTQFTSINVSADYTDTYSYTADALSLTLTPKLAVQVQTPNQRAVADALFNISGAATGDLRNALNQIDALPAAQANAALDQLSPISFTALGRLQFAASSLQETAVSRHLTDLAVGGAPPLESENDPPSGTLIASGGVGETPESWRDAVKTKDGGEYFASAVGSEGRVDSIDGAAGAQPGYTFHSGGGMMGVNTPGSEDFVVGFALGYVGGTADVGSGEGSVTSQSLRGGVFAARRVDDFHANLYLGGAFDSFSVTRDIPALSRQATSSPSGTEIDFSGQAGYDLRYRRMTFTPTVGLATDQLTVGPTKESGADSMDLSLGQQSAYSVRSDTGAKLAYRFGGERLSVTPYASAAYEHEFMNQSQNINAAFAGAGGAFTVATADLARSGMLLAAGCSLDWSQGTSIQLAYSKDTRADYDINTLLLHFAARFN
jgi:autotransporter-associated beta strand protein